MMVRVRVIIVWLMMMIGTEMTMITILLVRKKTRLLKLMKEMKIYWLPLNLNTNLALRMRISSLLWTKWSMKTLRRAKILVNKFSI